MLKKIVFVALVALLSACAKTPSSQVAVNPLTYTDIPDPDVIRVGEDYYMVPPRCTSARARPSCAPAT